MAEAKIYYQEDCNLSLLEGKTIAIIGYGSQGHAHALNAKESGCNVIIGLYEGSKSWAKAEKQGFQVYTAAEAAKRADIIMILINDELQADMYKKDIEPNLEAGNMLMFAHGFNIHFGCIKPPADVDVTMIAPKGPGHTVRSEYQAGKGVPCLVAVEQNATGKALDIALAYALAIGGARAGVLETTFRTETDYTLRVVCLFSFIIIVFVTDAVSSGSVPQKKGNSDFSESQILNPQTPPFPFQFRSRNFS